LTDTLFEKVLEVQNIFSETYYFYTH